MLVVYGIKTCATVKKTCRWLDLNQIDYRFHDFRSNGLSLDLLTEFIQHLGWQRLLNRSSTSWRSLEASQQADLTEAKAIELMLTMPTLIKRPVIQVSNKFLVGFDENLLQAELL